MFQHTAKPWTCPIVLPIPSGCGYKVGSLLQVNNGQGDTPQGLCSMLAVDIHQSGSKFFQHAQRC